MPLDEAGSLVSTSISAPLIQLAPAGRQPNEQIGRRSKIGGQSAIGNPRAPLHLGGGPPTSVGEPLSILSSGDP